MELVPGQSSGLQSEMKGRGRGRTLRLGTKVQRRRYSRLRLSSAATSMLWAKKQSNWRTKTSATAARLDETLARFTGEKGRRYRLGRGSHAFSRLAAGRRLPNAPLWCDACSQCRPVLAQTSPCHVFFVASYTAFFLSPSPTLCPRRCLLAPWSSNSASPRSQGNPTIPTVRRRSLFHASINFRSWLLNTNSNYQISTSRFRPQLLSYQLSYHGCFNGATTSFQI